mgnify:CR=1 FL=1
MKQYRKRVVLGLCMALCFLSLTACAASTAEEVKTADPQISMYIQQVNESVMQSIVSLDEVTAPASEEELLKADETGVASGVTSWIGVMKDTGAFVDVISTSVELTEDEQYVVSTMAQFENRNVEFKAFYQLDQKTGMLNPTSMSFSPEYTTGEKMSKAAMNTLMGMGTVFLVLIFISLIIGCFKFISIFEEKAKKKSKGTAPAEAVETVPAAPAEENLADDLELVAVITAAIAASTNSSADGLVVRSIRRVPGAKWKRA